MRKTETILFIRLFNALLEEEWETQNWRVMSYAIDKYGVSLNFDKFNIIRPLTGEKLLNKLLELWLMDTLFRDIEWSWIIQFKKMVTEDLKKCKTLEEKLKCLIDNYEYHIKLEIKYWFSAIAWQLYWTI